MSLPYFPMFPADFDADTGHLTLAEDGAYNRLLRLQWRAPGCKLPADMEWIFRKAKAVTEADRAVIASIIAEFFTTKGGKIFSARLLKEWVKSDVAHSKRVLAGKKGGGAKSLKSKETASSNAKAMLKQPEPEPEPERYTEANASDGDAVASPSDEVWKIGVAALKARGVAEPKARQMIGRWRKDHPNRDAEILTAIIDCGKAGAVDPIPWITARLTPRKPVRYHDFSAYGVTYS